MGREGKRDRGRYIIEGTNMQVRLLQSFVMSRTEL